MMLARKNTRRLDLSVFAILDFVTNMFSSLINVLIFVRKSGTHIGCSGWSGSSGSPDDPLGRSTTGWWSNQEVFPKDLVSGSEHLELDVLLWSTYGNEGQGQGLSEPPLEWILLLSGYYYLAECSVLRGNEINDFSATASILLVRYKSKWC